MKSLLRSFLLASGSPLARVRSAILDQERKIVRPRILIWPGPLKTLKRGALGLALGTWALSSAFSGQAISKVDFRSDVQPLLKQYCIECHGPSTQMHGFRLDRRRDAMRGVTSTVIVPGNSAGRRLAQWRVLASEGVSILSRAVARHSGRSRAKSPTSVRL